MTVVAPEASHRAEVIVIGSGPGGSVVAATLAEAGRDVLLIEEGSNLSQDSCAPFSFEEMKSKYRSGGITVAFGSPNIAYAEGSCVGGGSEVNSSLYHRTPDSVIEEWSKRFQVADLSPETMAKYFESCEAIMQPATYPAELPAASAILRLGAEREGMSTGDVPRLVNFSEDRDEQGVEISSRRGMSDTYIKAFHQAGGRLLPDTRALTLRSSGGQWQINARHKSAGALALEAANVFVCAGAVHTSALLQRSGIKTNVGCTFSMQPMVKLTAEFNEDVNFAGMGVAGEQVNEFIPEYSFGCAISSRAHLAINLAANPEGSHCAVENYRRMVSFYVMSRGTLNGSVRNIPGFNDPLVRYRISATEMDNLARGVHGLARLLLSAGATKVFTGWQDCPVVSDSRQLQQLSGSAPTASDNIMTTHIMSSCPMGEDRKRCAVNSWGQVHGHTGLYVADASTLCASPGVNPQGTIMALAKRNSEHFLET